MAKKTNPRKSPLAVTAKPSDNKLLSLPLELQSMVLKNVPKSALTELRMTSKDLNDMATPLLFHRLWISPSRRDQTRLFAASVHPAYRKMVREIAYDATNIMETLTYNDLALNRNTYTSMCLEMPREISVTSPVDSGLKMTKAASERGYARIQDAAKEQQRQLSRYNREDLSASKPFNEIYFRSLLEQPDKHDQVLHYLTPDLGALVSSIRAFDNLSSLIIWDTRYVLDSSRQRHTFPAVKRNENDTSELYAKEVTYRHVDKDVRGQDAVLIDPLTWPDNREAWPQSFDDNHYRGFAVLAQAASMVKMASIQTFSVERYSEFGGLSCSIFSFNRWTSRQLYHTKRAFQSLKTIDLKLNTEFAKAVRSSDCWLHVLAEGHIAECLGEARQLEELTIIFDEPVDGNYQRVPSLDKLVGTHTWTALRKVTLGNMSVDKTELLAFLNRHTSTLREYTGQESVTLDRGVWA